jgi:hypothetical protein
LTRPHRFYLAGFFVHLLFIVVCALSELAWITANGYTLLPSSVEDYAKRIEWSTDAAVGRSLPASNLIRQSLTTYLQCTGIDGGYAFFAPNVPNSYKVVFEIHYPNGEVEYELPHISRSATAVRLSTALHHIGRTEHPALRELMVKMLTYPVAREHPNATAIRTIFGAIMEPTATEAREGKKQSYKVLYAYDFTLPSPPAEKPAP